MEILLDNKQESLPALTVAEFLPNLHFEEIALVPPRISCLDSECLVAISPVLNVANVEGIGDPYMGQI